MHALNKVAEARSGKRKGSASDLARMFGIDPEVAKKRKGKHQVTR